MNIISNKYIDDFSEGFLRGYMLSRNIKKNGNSISDDVEWQIPKDWNLPDPKENQITAYVTQGVYVVYTNRNLKDGETLIVDWGDGSVDVLSTEYMPGGYIEHTYIQNGTYTIIITSNNFGEGYGDGINAIVVKSKASNAGAVQGLKYGYNMCSMNAQEGKLMYLKADRYFQHPKIDAEYLNGLTQLIRVDFNHKRTDYSRPIFLNNCPALQIIKGLDGLTNFNMTMHDNSMLQKINLPNCVNMAERTVFANCTSLKEINMPKLETINTDSSVFYNCTSLVNVNLPSLRSTSDKSAYFPYCTNLRHFNAPLLTNITSSEFYNCYMLKELILVDGCNFNGNTFGTCYNLDPKPQ